MTTEKKAGEWVVYHGGNLLGLGRWSSGHNTRQEALQSARDCCRVVGGAPTVEWIEEVNPGFWGGVS